MSKAWLLIAVLFVSGCGKELGRIPFAGEGSSSVSTALSAGNVAFWTDIDIKYEGPATLVYRVELAQGSTRVATAVCEPLGNLNAQLSWIAADHGLTHFRRGQGEMTCSVTLPKGGPTTVEATLAFDVRPLSATIRKADLIVKQ